MTIKMDKEQDNDTIHKKRVRLMAIKMDKEQDNDTMRCDSCSGDLCWFVFP